MFARKTFIEIPDCPMSAGQYSAVMQGLGQSYTVTKLGGQGATGNVPMDIVSRPPASRFLRCRMEFAPAGDAYTIRVVFLRHRQATLLAVVISLLLLVNIVFYPWLTGGELSLPVFGVLVGGMLLINGFIWMTTFRSRKYFLSVLYEVLEKAEVIEILPEDHPDVNS